MEADSDTAAKKSATAVCVSDRAADSDTEAKKAAVAVCVSERAADSDTESTKAAVAVCVSDRAADSVTLAEIFSSPPQALEPQVPMPHPVAMIRSR